jgi:hypothetical protein
MKKLHLVCFASALLGLTASIHAIPAASGNLILGFRATEAPGADTNLEVNLGPVSAFTAAAAGSTSVLTGLSVEDLAAVYGPNWKTRTDLSWGIVGTTGTDTVGTAPARTIWASAPEAVPGTQSAPWTVSSASGLQNASNAIATMYSGPTGSLMSTAANAVSPTTVKVNAALGGSWTVQDDLTSGVSFRRFNPSVRITGAPFPVAGSAYDGTGYSVLDLWELRPGASGDPGTLVGGFGLNNAGKLVFSKDITKFAPSTGPAELGIPTIVRSGGSNIISLTGVSPGNYILERSPSMTAGSWTDLLTPQSPVAGTLTFTDNAPPAPRGFYRIKTSP